MKTIKLFIAALTLSTAAFASDTKVINPDSIIDSKNPFSEGTETTLSTQQISVLKDWANTTKSVLEDYLDTASSMKSKAEAIKVLRKGIEEAVLSSQRQTTELLMRYVLNRSLVILDTLDRETDNNNVASLDTKIRLLEQSIRKALQYYNADLNYLEKMNSHGIPSMNIAFAKFGIDYATFLMNLANSVFDASAQYQLYRLSLGLLQWDLNRDNDRLKYAEQIMRINSRLGTLPKDSPADDQTSIDLIRKMKKTVQTLGMTDLIQKMANGSTMADVGASLGSTTTPVARNGKYVFGANGSYMDWNKDPYYGVICSKFTSSGVAYEKVPNIECETKVGYYVNWRKDDYYGVVCSKFTTTNVNYEKVSNLTCETSAGFYYQWVNDQYYGTICEKMAKGLNKPYEKVSNKFCE